MTRLDRLVSTLDASLSVAAAQLDRDLDLVALGDDDGDSGRAYARAYGYLRGAVAAHLAEAQR
ncbi:hypothetical protein [Prescottella equi]